MVGRRAGLARKQQERMEQWQRPGASAASDAYQFLLARAGDPGSAGGGEHVHFAADAELGVGAIVGRQVDAGLDAEAGVGQNLALVVSFEVIEMRAGAVELGGDVVAGAMGEIVAESGV